MGKPTICIGADKLRSNCEADQRLSVFATRIVQFLYFLNPKILASNHLLLRLCNPFCVGFGRDPNCWFSHAQAHLCTILLK